MMMKQQCENGQDKDSVFFLYSPISDYSNCCGACSMDSVSGIGSTSSYIGLLHFISIHPTLMTSKGVLLIFL